MRPITGAELTVVARPADAQPAAHVHLTLLVEDATGYRNLCRLLTAAHAHTRDNTARTREPPWATLEQVEEHAEGLVCLSGCARDGALAGAWERARHGRAASGSAGACSPPSAASASGSSCSAPTGATTAPATAGSPSSPPASASPPWRPATSTPTTAAAPASRTPSSRSGWGETLEESEPRRRGNRSSALVSPAAMAARFAEHPEAVAETVRLAERLAVRPDHGARLPPPAPGRPHRRPRARPSSAAHRLAERYAGQPRRAEAEARLERELATIRHLNLSGFFLLHHELLELAREVAVEVRGRASARAVLPPGRGRGSSVSSIVCYLTGLSHIDPVKNEPLLRPLPQRRSADRCRTSTSTSPATSARC